jgi:hypothetical protein
MPPLQSSDSVESQYLKIKEVSPSRPGAFSKVYGVFSKSAGYILGHISYYHPSKKYVLKSDSGSIWDEESLSFLSEFIKTLGGTK